MHTPLDTDKTIVQQKEHYAAIASAFDSKYTRENSNHFYKVEEIEKAFLDNLPKSKTGYDFMEVGAGSGIHAKHFAVTLKKQIKSFLLNDLSPEMLEQAKKRMKEFSFVDYIDSPAERIPPTKQMDGIYVSGSMHHFTDYRQAISDMKSHLKENGILVICEPNVWNPINLIKVLKEFSIERGQFTVTRKNVTEVLREQKFEIMSSRVLHYRGTGKLFARLYPYRKLENWRWFDPLSIMFLVVAKHQRTPPEVEV